MEGGFGSPPLLMTNVKVVALKPFPLPTGALAQEGEVYTLDDEWAAMFASRLVVDPRGKNGKNAKAPTNKMQRPKEDK